jgi:hypothetical protein
MASTAADIKARFKTPKTVTVAVPGTDLVFECRYPDLVKMALSGLMTWPALERVRQIQADLAAPDAVLDNRPLPTVIDRAQAVGEMLDDFICAASVSPRIVMYEHEESANTVWVGDLPFEAKQAIFLATFRITPTAGADFRGEESAGAPPGQGGEAVRAEALVAVGSD